MANNLKGITVDIGGNTDKLTTALQGVNKTSKDLQAELKQVNALLKFDPSNTELLGQKQKLLAQDITNTKDKIETLKTAEYQAQEQFKKGKISEEQFRALQREIVATESKLKGLETQARKANGELTSDKAISNLKGMGQAAVVGAGVAVVAIGAVAVAALGAADELQKQADITGLSVERLQELNYAGNKLGVDLETITGAQAKLTKAMAAGKDGTGAQADAFKALGISVINSDGTLRDSKVVMEEAFTALGKVGNETERDALAMTIFGKSGMQLNPIIKAGGEELNRLSTEARNSGAVMSGEAVKGLDDFGDGIDGMKQAIISVVGEALAQLMPYINDLILKLTELPIWLKENETLITVIGIALGTFVVSLIAYNVAAAWGTISTWALATAAGALAGAIAFLTSPITLTIAAIGAIIAVGYLLWKNWDTIGAKAKEIFGGMGRYIGGIMDSITGGFKGMANGVIGFLNPLIIGINKLKFDVPSWVPFIGGLKFGFNIPTIPRFDVGTRRLPQDMLIQAHKDEMIVPAKENPYANSGGQIMPTMDPREFAREVRKELEKIKIVAVIAKNDFDKGVDKRVLALGNT